MNVFASPVKNLEYSVHYNDPAGFRKVEKAIYSYLVKYNADVSRLIIYLCIGTDRATGDCLGPLVGTRLKNLLPQAMVFGTLENPVHASNLEKVLAEINLTYINPLLIAIDACLGRSERIGFININQGSLKPGTALNKTLPEVGDFHISGVVNVSGFLEHLVLQNTRLHTVYMMADVIAKGIYLANSRLEQKRISPVEFVF